MLSCNESGVWGTSQALTWQGWSCWDVSIACAAASFSQPEGSEFQEEGYNNQHLQFIACQTLP